MIIWSDLLPQFFCINGNIFSLDLSLSLPSGRDMGSVKEEPHRLARRLSKSKPSLREEGGSLDASA